MAQRMNAPLYTTEILRLAASIPEPKSFEPHGSAELRSPTCGSTIRVEVRVDEHGRVSAISQRIHACAFGQASTALMGANAIGRNIEEVTQVFADLSDWLAGKRDDPGTWPGLEALAPARSRKSRHGAILLPFRALVAALESRR